MSYLVFYHLRRAKEYLQRVYYTSPFLGEDKLQILEKLFIESNRFLGDLGAQYWINYGTLLGYHRSNSLIAHDIDIDFGAREYEAKRIWENRHLLPRGFKMHDSSNRHYGPKLYISYKGYDADIYFYKEMEDVFEPYEKTHWKNYRIPIPKAYILPLQAARFLEQTTYVPAETEKYLNTMYGSLEAGAVRNPKTGLWEMN